MIISASRRTDIPAFYSEWFFNRIEEGYLMVRNPMSYHQVSKISLCPDVVDCIVFWTKNPTPMIDKIHLLKDYAYYFQYTINSYDTTIEPGVPKKKYLVDVFKRISEMIGKHRIIWRYDPIILSESISESYHYEYFECLANILKDYTEKCVISFIDMYKKTERNVKHLNIKAMRNDTIKEMAKNIYNIGKKYNLCIESCAEDIDLDDIGIKHGKCIDDTLISRIIGEKLDIDKDKNQREICGCVSSIDIGAYNTCNHKCTYCYANYSEKMVNNSLKKHSPHSPLLVGELGEDDKVSDREMKSLKQNQISLFDFKCDKKLKLYQNIDVILI